ncbi:hypothetical protein [Bifidobacterium sp.]|uniref:hypothetical protein n=1 Tax=Bifidobacterium sp. TaxID=41200 RepID=UPI003D7C5D26
MDYQNVEQPSVPRRRAWPIVLAVVVACVVACGISVYVYHGRQQEALAACRQSLADFSTARKSVLDTSDNSGELQKLARDVFGVDDILDAFADAATSAENTVDVEGCKANATITQLNLVAKTLDGATDSLNTSLKNIREKKTTDSSQDADDDDSSKSTDDTSSEQSSDGRRKDSYGAGQLAESKKELQKSIDKANRLMDRLSKDDTLTLTGRKLMAALSKAMDSGRKLIENSDIKDSKYYKAAKVTLDEAIDMADNWVNSQAAKAQ